MSDILHEHREVVDRLRALADTASPATRAQPDLADLVLRQSRVPHRHRRRWVLGACGSLAVAGAVAAAAAALPGHGNYFRQYEPSAIMEPTVKVGEHLVAGKQLEPQRGDLVVFHFMRDGANLDVIQRVIGIPGDRVACPPAGPAGRCDAVIVNARPLPEPYVNGSAGVSFPETVVPAGQLFLLGDNRDMAIDSRTIGPVAENSVKGVGVRITSSSGAERVIPGAPARPGPKGSDTTDPQDLPPGSATSPR